MKPLELATIFCERKNLALIGCNKWNFLNGRHPTVVSSAALLEKLFATCKRSCDIGDTFRGIPGRLSNFANSFGSLLAAIHSVEDFLLCLCSCKYLGKVGNLIPPM